MDSGSSLATILINLGIQLALILVNAFLEQLLIDLLFLNQDHKGRQQGWANHFDVIQVDLLLIRSQLLIHEFTDRQLQSTLHVALLVEFDEHIIHPFGENLLHPTNFELVRASQQHRKDEDPVVKWLKVEIVSEFCLQGGHEQEMPGHLGVEHDFDNHFSTLLEIVDLQILHNVEVLVTKN